MSKELLTKAQAGDEQAFTEMLQEISQKTRDSLYVVYKGLSPHDYEDGYQIACMRAWTKISTFRGESSFFTWFYRILNNEILNIVSKKNKFKKEICFTNYFYPPDSKYAESQGLDHKIERNIPNMVVFETAQSLLEKKEEIQEYKEMLDTVLRKLEPAHSEVIELVLNQGKSYEEASQALSIPVGTVMSRLCYARRKAKKLIKSYATIRNLQHNNA